MAEIKTVKAIVIGDEVRCGGKRVKKGTLQICNHLLGKFTIGKGQIKCQRSDCGALNEINLGK